MRRLEIQLQSQNKEMEMKEQEIRNLKIKINNKLSRNQGSNHMDIFDDKLSKSFSSRSFTSPSPMKKKNFLLKENSKNNSTNEIERNLLKFMMFLEDKAIPAIQIYKEEYRKIRDKQNNQCIN